MTPNPFSRALAFFVLLFSAMGNTTRKILIVDSNDSIRKSLGAFIKELGHEVYEVATGLEVFDKVSSIRPDLIMMDVRLPGMSGDEVTAQLKRNLSTRNIPVVINTGWNTGFNIEERVHRARIAGAAEILYRPVQLPILRDVLRTYLLA